MASLARELRDSWRIVYRDGLGRQRTFRLGRCPRRAAQTVLLYFEKLVAACRLGVAPDSETVRWLEGLDERLYNRLARLGLVEPRARAPKPTLGELIEQFYARCTASVMALAAYRQGIGSLLEFFGEKRPLDEITAADAEAWRRNLSNSKLAAATISKRTRTAKMIF
jgi:hypothetical protein